MTRTAVALAICAFPALPAVANEFQAVRDESRFLELIEGRELRLGVYGISIRVNPDGKIDGEALGWGVTGTWNWDDGYFCRELDWSGTSIPFNCQLVEARGDSEMRFTVDRGAGDSASFRLR